MTTVSDYQAFHVELTDNIAHVQINRPEKVNSMNAAFWSEIIDIFQWIDETDEVRVVVLSGAGKHFSSGIDLMMLASVATELGKDAGRNARVLRRKILQLQASFNAVDSCRKPVLAAIQGYCLGGAIDLIAACDMRYAAEDAQFSIKEIDMGMAADVGTLQRLPRIIGDGMLRELAYTGRTIGAEEARSIGLVNRTFVDTQSLLEGVMAIAGEIASKSPIAIAGTKEMISYMRDHRIDDGLEYVATWNAAMLQSADLRLAMTAHMSKQKAVFDNRRIQPLRPTGTLSCKRSPRRAQAEEIIHDTPEALDNGRTGYPGQRRLGCGSQYSGISARRQRRDVPTGMAQASGLAVAQRTRHRPFRW
jgi:enoyl-CoA hydratase